MKYIISGTDRHQSRTLQVAQYVQRLYTAQGEDVEIIDLNSLPLSEVKAGTYTTDLSERWKAAIGKVNTSEGLHIIVPEYNGSMPGALKYFIDQWTYPLSFESRPVCFVGLGGMFGGCRPVEHLQQVFGYRNAYIFPQRIFMQQIHKIFENGEVKDPIVKELLKNQVATFSKFVVALQGARLVAPFT